MTYTGTQIARSALRRLGVLDPIEAGHAEMLDDALAVGSKLLDSWRTSRLTISGITRNVYSLSSGTQSHTIGSGGTFSQDYPQAIERWGVIPDDDASDPQELPMGRPLTSREWAAIPVKSTTGAYPTSMWYDSRYASGLGRCLFYPVPNNADVDVALYVFVPAITSLVAATSYDLTPGYHLALEANLALEIAESGRYSVPQETYARIVRAASRSLGALKRAHIQTSESPIRPEFLIGGAGVHFNIRTDQ